MDLRYREESQEDEDDLSSPYANEMEIAVLNKEECHFTQQKKFGRILKPEEVAIFRMRVLEPQFMAYRCDFFAYGTANLQSQNFVIIFPWDFVLRHGIFPW